MLSCPDDIVLLLVDADASYQIVRHFAPLALAQMSAPSYSCIYYTLWAGKAACLDVAVCTSHCALVVVVDELIC
jgi:hypothetical protein